MTEKKPINVDEIVDQLIDLWKKGISQETLTDMTRNYLIGLKLAGNEQGYNELIPKIKERQREEIEKG
ncbi:hypothetical protein [Neobacillus cucumis]|uniref:hypothetical protein n=1 Tax=Neobacillus cucumis TaxID=1740721 RepID=UPI00196644E8|nr:hypothetical protein [Neobacillus cucumis]MBM7656209.1 hypothetical protein [Neobacillus cucumis]